MDYCIFCLNCDTWCCWCSCMGGMSVSSCICTFVSCVNPVAVRNAAFLILVEDARGDHMERCVCVCVCTEML